MPTRVSTIESHPQRDEIIKALANEQPYRIIEGWTVPTVSTGALSRFKRHSMHKLLSSVTVAKQAIANNDNGLQKSDMQSVTKAALTVAVDPFLSHVIKSAARRERWIDMAENADNGPDHRALAAHDRNDLSSLELHARLAGRLDTGANQLTVQVVFGQQPGAQAPPSPDDFDGVTLDIKR